MARDEQPLLGRGTTETNMTAGAAGMSWLFEDVDYSTSNYAIRPRRTNRKVRCVLVKNSSGIALLPRRMVVWKAGTNQTEVDGYATTTAAEVAGVVDEWLPTAGVANGDYFLLVVGGPTLVVTDLAAGANNLIPERTVLVALTAATSQATTAGRPAPQDLTGATALLGNQLQNAIGRALSAKTTANTNVDLLIDLVNRWSQGA